jgi:hypothetical protein
MAELTSGARNDLPASTFALPAKRAYPIPDASHAANAKARATQQYNAGNLSAGQKATIDAKANAKLGHPREHSLAMASADHLHKGGYISGGMRDSIRAKASAKLDAHKAAKPMPAPYGSWAPK